MNRVTSLSATAAIVLALAGCATSGPQERFNTVVGAGFGAVVGGLATGNTGGAVVGALAGGMVGNVIGADLDARDRQIAMEAEYRALEHGRTGSPVQWRGQGGRYGDVVPGAQYRVNDYSCRDYTHTIYIDGRPQVARGTACREGEGVWRPVG